MVSRPETSAGRAATIGHGEQSVRADMDRAATVESGDFG